MAETRRYGGALKGAPLLHLIVIGCYEMCAQISICLNMIVKNEAHIIAETLRTVCAQVPVSYWVICDTGSTDATRKIIRRTFADIGIDGELHDRPWVNFAHNRNQALELCKGKSDFVMFFDADDKLVGRPDFSKLTADAYHMYMSSDSEQPTRYLRKLLVRNDGRAKWRGVVHEFISTANMKVAILGGDYTVISRRLGARSKDPEKYKNDALLLEAAFKDPKDEDLKPRYAFYCANSWKDYGQFDKALEWYKRRIGLKGWIEERYISCLEGALINERNGDKISAVDWLLRGYEFVPDRSECIYHAARILRSRSLYRAAFALAKEGVKLAMPKGNRLFIKSTIYQYAMVFEYLMLVGRMGANPADTPFFKTFLESAAPDAAKTAIKGFVKQDA